MSRFRDVQQEIDQAKHERLVYPLTGVMLNKLGLRDNASLSLAERTFTTQRIEQGLPDAAKAHSFDGLKAIHRHLFQDVYSWAGEPRDYTTRRSELKAFARPQDLEPSLNKIFADFRAAGELKNLDPKSFAVGAARFVSEINAVHPFPDGNGRSQRAWLSGAARNAGYQFAVKPEERHAYHDAARRAFESLDYAPMARLIETAIRDPNRLMVGPGSERADAFATLSRSAAVATGDPALKTAWDNLDVVRAVARSSRPDDAAFAEKLVSTARQQMVEAFRQGREVVPHGQPAPTLPGKDRAR